MPWFNQFLSRLRALFTKNKLDAEMAEEMHQHLELRTRRNIAAGMAPDEARYAAQREFGGVEQIKEQARDQRDWRWLETLRQDLRFSGRMLTRHPAFAVAAILTLGLGIGFVTALFTIINGTMLRELPLPDGRRIVRIRMPVEQFATVQEQQGSFEHLALFEARAVNLGIGERASRQRGARVSAGFLATLQMPPARGRGFRPDENQPGATAVVLVSHRLWQEELGGTRDPLGRIVRVNGEPHTVVGVMPEGFGFPHSEALWRPLPEEPDAANNAEVIGRLRAGVTPAQAAVELTTIVRRAQPAGPTGKMAVEVTPYAANQLKDSIRNVLLAILAATFLVLALACANVANLFLARASERSRELAVRAAVGATRRRLVVQLMTETLVLCVIGAGVGGWLAYAGTQFAWRYLDGERELTLGSPYWIDFKMDVRVFLFVTGATLLAAVLSGLVPALRASRLDVNERLKAGGGGTLRLSRFSRLLVNVQMAFTVVLVTTSGLFATVLFQARQKELPYRPASVLTARLAFDATTYPTPARRAAVQQELLEALQAQPEVEAAALTTATALRLSERRIQFEGETYARTNDAPWCGGEAVSGDFFAALNARLLAGRSFASTDGEGSPLVALVTPAFAERFGGGHEVLGRRFRFGPNGQNARWITIVGVISDPGSVKTGRVSDGPRFYQPVAQAPASELTLVVRARAEAGALGETLRRVVATVDRDLPLAQLLTGQRILELERVGINLPATLFMVCGAAALLLATVGIYGVISLSVRNRTREFGVRLALGADRRAIMQLVLGGGLRDIAIGLVVGILLAAAASVAVRTAFVGLLPAEKQGGIFVAVAAVLGSVGAIAFFVPARRAAKVDPMVALRCE